MYPHQAERLGAALTRHGLDALVATAPDNVRYVSGFVSPVPPRSWPDARFAVYTLKGVALVLPMIDVVTLADEPVDVEVVVPYGDLAHDRHGTSDTVRRLARWSEHRAEDAIAALRRALATLGVESGAVGLDDSGLTVTAWDALGALSPRPAAHALAGARMVKAPWEIECLARALRVAEEGANAVMQMLKPGVTEREAAQLYEEDVRRRGGIPDMVLVGFGPRSGLPASAPSDRSLRNGDLVRLAVGAVVSGYHGDVARVAVMGMPNGEQERLYEAIAAGHERGIDAIRPGETGARIFEATVVGVRAAGREGYTRTEVGHGVGLAHHEPPWLAPREATALEAGMVVQVENAWYEVGAGGVHLKDTLLVTREEARVLNASARGLVVLD